MEHCFNNFVERVDYNKVITIKLVIPSGCQANCKFCYMKDYNGVMLNDKKIFMENFLTSLEYMLNEIDNKNNVSLDITGNEPTYDVDFLKKVLLKLKEFNIREKVLRITITTNGFHLREMIPYFEDVISYVNISTHHYDYYGRKKIFQCNPLTDTEYKFCVDELKSIGIYTSAVCVVFEKINNFENFMNNFVEWCEDCGFVSLRFRNDVFWQRSEFVAYMNIAINNPSVKVIEYENTSDSHWCRLRKYNKFKIFFLKGVKDTSIDTKGIEYVIADDGKAYADFYKNVKIEDYPYKIGKVYDRVIDV